MMSDSLTPVQQEAVYRKIRESFSDWQHFDAVVGAQVWCTILETDINKIGLRTVKNAIQKYYPLRFDLMDKKVSIRLRKIVGFIKLIFRCTFVELLAIHRFQDTPRGDPFNYIEYPLFDSVVETELEMLHSFRFYLRISFLVHRHTNKQAHLDVAGRMSGSQRRVAEGSNYTCPSALRRVIIYEFESNSTPTARPKQLLKGSVARTTEQKLAWRNAQIAKNPLPPPSPSTDEIHPVTEFQMWLLPPVPMPGSAQPETHLPDAEPLTPPNEQDTKDPSLSNDPTTYYTYDKIQSVGTQTENVDIPDIDVEETRTSTVSVARTHTHASIPVGLNDTNEQPMCENQLQKFGFMEFSELDATEVACLVKRQRGQLCADRLRCKRQAKQSVMHERQQLAEYAGTPIGVDGTDVEEMATLLGGDSPTSSASTLSSEDFGRTFEDDDL